MTSNLFFLPAHYVDRPAYFCRQAPSFCTQCQGWDPDDLLAHPSRAERTGTAPPSHAEAPATVKAECSPDGGIRKAEIMLLNTLTLEAEACQREENVQFPRRETALG